MLDKLIDFVLIRLLLPVAATALTLMMLITTADVILRFVFNWPLPGSYELVEMGMGVLTPIAIVYCTRRGGQVSVDLLYVRLPAGARRTLRYAGNFIVLFLSVLLCWQSVYLVEEIMETNLSTSILGLPMWPLAVCMLAAFLVLVPVVWRRFAQSDPENDAEEEAHA